jgi:hypothetical protein
MTVHLAELFRVLHPGGVVAYAVANSTRRGRDFDLVDATRDMLRGAGFVDIQTVARGLGDKHILPVFRDAKSGRFASEGINGVRERIVYANKPR